MSETCAGTDNDLTSQHPFSGPELGPENENAALRDLLLAEIAGSGPITFERFMEVVLYHPREGYYASPREKIGPAGDYLTSPEISPIFGYALARQVAELWRCLGSPAPFDLVEAGGGNGTLARDILRWSALRDPDFYAALLYTILEMSPAMRAVQQELLQRWLSEQRLRIVDGFAGLGGKRMTGCILSNELLDSFPVHRVTVRGGQLMEIFVAVSGPRLVERLGPPSTDALAAYFSRLGLQPGEGNVAEVNLAAPRWLSEAAGILERGTILTLDYGYEAARLYAPWRRTGTLLCFHRHTASDDPYIRLGRQDLTAHVDFTSLIQAGEACGLQLLGFTDQRRFLASLGAGDAVRLDPGQAEPALEDYFSTRRAVASLLDPDGLGRVRVLLLGKEVPACQLTGFGLTPRPPLQLNWRGGDEVVRYEYRGADAALPAPT